ncbi:DUF349 domain-containing protein [Marinobacter sp.]|uniref:DUF349 domain-containing protein n=1 Tax=Marinobacter sp. TaxID=50741 RepID=UPI00384E2AC1
MTSNPTTQQLEMLSLEGKSSDIRLRAAEAITDREALQRLQKAARGRDKNVYQMVRQKLQLIREAEAEQERMNTLVQEAIRQAEEHAVTENTRLYEARLDNLLRHWSEAEPFASSGQTAAFLNAVHQCRERVNAMKFEEDQQRLHQNRAEERANTISMLESTLTELKAQPEGLLASLASLDALQKTQENRWLEATRETQVEKSEQRAYESWMQALRGYIAAVQRFSQQADQIDELMQAVESASATGEWESRTRDLLKTLDWPEGFNPPAALNGLRTALGEARPKTPDTKPEIEPDRQKEKVSALSDTLDRLEAALEARQLRESRQLFKQAQQEHRRLDARNGRPFQAKIQLLGGQLRELLDWQGFATQPKQIELCKSMEYLADQPMDPEVKAEKIKELQNEWRDLGGSSERDLWQRFKQASDRAYEPCREYFSAKSDLKKNHLEKRRAICGELEHFVLNTDWSAADWKAVEQIHRVARDEWKAAWPVDFRDNRPLQKRFDELLTQVEAPLNAEREKNEQLKQSVVERAQALVSHEPLAEAMNQAKALQAEWKSIGLTRHREDRKLWQEFRAACDQVFARRDSARQEQRSQTLEANERSETLLAETAAITDPSGETGGPVHTALGDLKAVQAEPLSAAMAERIRTEIARLSRLQEQASLSRTLDTWQELIHQRLTGEPAAGDCPPAWHDLASLFTGMPARELVIRAEIITALPSPEDDQPRRMEIQVQRLAEGMSGTGNSGSLLEQMEALVAAWYLAASAEEITEALAERLAAAVRATML